MKRKSISISQFQKNQITTQTFKRNKMFLNISKIQNNQKQFQIKRRMPYLLEGSPKAHIINNKIGKTFRNSVEQLTNKVDQQMRKFKDRISPPPHQKILNDIQTGYQTSRTSFNNPQIQDMVQSNQVSFSGQRRLGNLSFAQLIDSKKQNIKGISIDKQISRDYLCKLHVQNHQAVDERNFSNFYITKHDLSKTQDFKKLSPRKISFINQNINDLNYNTQKTYQRVYYSTKPMKSTFRYSLQNSQQGRSFFVPVDPNGVAKTALQPQKIKKSFTEASNFRTDKIDSFFKMTGRSFPHQLDQRHLSPNKNFYKDREGRLIVEKTDYSVKKMYDDLLSKQKEQQTRKKNPEFSRDQICDQRYFNQMIKKERKMLQKEKKRMKMVGSQQIQKPKEINQ